MKCIKPSTPYLLILIITFGLSFIGMPEGKTTELTEDNELVSHTQFADVAPIIFDHQENLNNHEESK